MNRQDAMPKDIVEILKAYFSKREEVVGAFLFGSHAKKRQRADSDVDVAVLLTHEAALCFGELRTLYTVELGAALRMDVHPVIMNTAGEELLKQIYSKGECVQVNDERACASFRIAAYCRIADFDHYRQLAQRRFIDRLNSEAGSG